MKKPAISVVINTYNGEKVVANTLKSFLSQSFSDFEIIVVDDCSTDNTIEVVKSIDDSRITVYKNENNMGSAYSAQRGVELARGEYIAKSDQDDISYPNRLETQKRFMDEHEDVFLCGSYHNYIFDDGHKESAENTQITNARDYRYSLLFGYYAFIHSSFFFRRQEAIDKGIKYRKYTFSEDYDFLMQAVLKSKVYTIKEVLVGYHIHDGQLTNYMTAWGEDKSLIKWYCKKMRINKDYTNIAIKGECGNIVSFNEFALYIKLFYLFALRCGVDRKNSKDKQLMRYVFRRGMRIQRQRNVIELFMYLISGLCDWQFIFSKNGWKYIKHCVSNGFRETKPQEV